MSFEPRETWESTKHRKNVYYRLCRIIENKGEERYKKHGSFYDLDLCDGTSLTLDSYNKQIITDNDGCLGIDFGGFEIKVPFTVIERYYIYAKLT